MNPYQTLGLDPSATPAEIKTAYRNATKTHHPDRGGESERFREIQRAYEVLIDPDLREEFDRTGRMPGARESAEDIPGLILEVYSQVVEATFKIKEIERLPILDAVRSVFKDRQKDLRKRIRSSARVSNSLERMRRRIIHKTDSAPTIFDQWLEVQLAEIEDARRICERKIALAGQCLTWLEAYADAADEAADQDIDPSLFDFQSAA